MVLVAVIVRGTSGSRNASISRQGQGKKGTVYSVPFFRSSRKDHRELGDREGEASPRKVL